MAGASVARESSRTARARCERVGSGIAMSLRKHRAVSRRSCSPTSRRPRTRRRVWVMTLPPRSSRATIGSSATLIDAHRGRSRVHGRRLPRAVRLGRAARWRARWRSSASSPAQEDGIRVRIGLNAGEVLEDDGELFGAAINLASRVMDRAGGGEILITDDSAPARRHDARRALPRPRPRRAQGLPRAPAAARGAAGRAPARRPRAPRRSSGARRLAAAALALAAAAAAAVVAGHARRGAPCTCARTASRSSTPTTGASSSRSRSAFAPPTWPSARGSVWVANLGDNTVTQIGARSRRVAGTVTPGISVDGLGGRPERRLGRRQRARASARRSTPTSAASRARSDSAPWTRSGRSAGRGDGRRRLDRALGQRIARVDPGAGAGSRRSPSATSPSGVAVGRRQRVGQRRASTAR